jgi:hypothetical protein
MEFMKEALAEVLYRYISMSHCNRANSHSGVLLNWLLSIEWFGVQAEAALAEREVPVGCVFVRNGTIIARGRNATNRTRNVCVFLLFVEWNAGMKPCQLYVFLTVSLPSRT